MKKQDYSTTEIYMPFVQNCLMIFEEVIRSVEKDTLTAPELFDIMCKLRQKLIQQKKMTLWKEDCFRTQKNVIRKGQPN